jgi:hypothetical protein
MTDSITNGSKREIDGRVHIYFDGYWIKYYAPPQHSDSLAAKKTLIEALTRRLFNHVEHGINIPGRRLDQARAAFEAEEDPQLKRVKGAMLAGALFNRAADIFTKLVDLQALGVDVETDNSLMRECGRCLMEALELGKNVRHRCGDECIEELWGEPFKAFSVPVDAFYDSRYIKIAQTKRTIDRIADTMIRTFALTPLFQGVEDIIETFAASAKGKCETLRTDPDIFTIWPEFVVAGERLTAFEPQFPLTPTKATFRLAEQGTLLLKEGKVLVTSIARARVPMTKSTDKYLERCASYRISIEAVSANAGGRQVHLGAAI